MLNHHLLQQNRQGPIEQQELSSWWLIARHRRELAIIESNRTHPLNRASASQLRKFFGGCPPSVLHAIALIEAGLERQTRWAVRVSRLHEAIREQVELMDMWTVHRAMWYLTHYQEDNEPTIPEDAAHELIEIVRLNLMASGVDMVEPW